MPAETTSTNEILASYVQELHRVSCKKLAILRQIIEVKPAAALMCGLSQYQAARLKELTVSEIMGLNEISDVNRTLFSLALTDSSLDCFVKAMKEVNAKGLALDFVS